MTWDSKHLAGKAKTRDIVEAAQAWVPQMKEEGADIVIALSHSGIEVEQMARMHGERLAPARRRRGHRRDLHRPPASRLPRPEDFEASRASTPPRARCRRQAGGDGRLLGLASGADRPAARTGRQRVEDRSVRHPRPGRSSSASRARTRRPVEEHSRTSRPLQGRARGDARLCPHARSARPRRRSIPISRWSPTTRRCRSSPRRRPGTSRRC